MNNVTLHNVDDPHIIACFEQALAGYPRLQQRTIVLVQERLKSTTMLAQPIANLHVFSRKHRSYRVAFNPSVSLADDVSIKSLPTEVLVGWFAHELGHVMDYLDRSWLNLLRFALFYVASSTFRIGVERKADIFAIEHGFADLIITTKKFILEHSSLPNAYKSRIERYYMSPDEIAALVAENAAAEEEELKFDKLI